MAEAVTQEVMQKKEGKVGMTTLTFRSKQYTFPSLIVKPDAQPGTVATPDAENICVLLDVGLFCPFCTGTFTAKFVRSHGRLALNKQGNFELTGEQAVGGGMHPGQMVLAPEHSDHACCGQHGNTQPPPQDSDGDMGDFGLRRNVEKEFNESGIHVHITPQAPSEQPKFAKIVPLSSQHSHHHQPQLQQRSHHHHGHSHSHHRHHHNQGPHSARETRHHDHSKQREQDPLVLERQKLMKQNLKQQHRERQMQIRQQQSRYLQSLENNQQRMTQLKAGQVYVEQKSSQYVIKHDLTKKHKRVPPPPPPKHSLKQKSPKPESKQPKLPKEGSPAKVRKQIEQPQYTPEQRKRRGSSVDRQEIIYEGENIAQGGCIETNLDDFSQIVTSREIAGQIRTPPVKPRNLTSRDHSSPEARSPTRIDPYRVIAKRKRKGHVATERQRDENQNVVHRQPEALTIEKPDTKHESLEQLTPTRTSQHAPWASDNDIYRQPLPVNRLAKQTPPKIPPRIRKPEQQLPVPATRPSQRESSETRSTTSEEGRSSVRSKSSMSEAEQENWIKISKVSRGSRAPEILGPVVEPARNESQEVPKKESSTRKQIRSHTDERIINYIGEQAAIHNFPQEQVQGANIASSPSLSQKDYRGARASPSTIATQSVGSSSHDHERNELNVTSDSAFNEIRKLSSQEGDESDTASEEADDVFNPEDALDEILESVETETYSPTSTLSRAFTGPRGKKKKKKPIEELQRPLEVPDEEAELHEAVAQIIDNELRTPSPETFLDEILEGVDDGETVTDAQDWDAKHSKTTTASMNTKTTTTYTSELLHQTVVAHGSSETRDSQPRSDSSESPARESLESTLTALNANQSAKPSSPSTSCECLPEDGGDNLSVGKSTYDGTSENSENDEARDSESPGYPVSRKKPGSDTSIEKIIDRTLFLTDKILAAYPEIEQNEQLADRNDSTLASVATQSSLSDYEEVPDTEDSQEDVELEVLVSEEVDKAIKEDSRKKDNIDYQFHGAYDELNQYMKRSEGNEASLLKETFDSQLSVKTESDFINADFHSSKAYSPPSPQMSGPVSIDYSGPVAMRDDREHQVSTERATEMDDPRAQGIKLEKVTKDLYDIQHSLASEGETWLIEDFYEDTEFAELESMSSDQGTMEKKRLSRHLAEQVKEEATVDGQRHHPEMSGESDTDAAGVPRKVQFWVPHRERGAETEEEEEELKDLESFEEVEERLREMERTVKEMGALDSLDAPSDLDQEAFSKEDLREVDDDQYNSEHTTEDLDQLESSCNEDIGSEIDDVIEALMMDEQFGDDSAEIIESGTDSYVHEDVKKPSYSHDKKLGPLRYVSPISTSGSESESEVESKDSSSHECDDRVPEVTIANAEAQTLMQDFVKADTKQRSEVCITYVNVDGSSSDSITDPFVDESESESVIFVNKSSIAGSLDSVKLKEVDEEIKEQTRQEILTHTTRLVNLEMNQEPELTRQEILTHTTRLVNLEMNQEPEVPNNEVDKRREATKRVITPTVVVDKSSSSESSDESEADSAKDFENIYKSYAESDQVETETSVLPSQYELEEQYLGTHASVPVSDALRRKRQEKKEKESKPLNEETMEIFNREEEDQIKKSITQDKDSGDLIRWSPDSDEKQCKEDPETKVEKVKGDETGTSTTAPTSEPQQEGSGTVAVSSTTSEKVLAQSTNVATFETEEVLSKKQAQEFLKHMFGANHAGGHKKESEDLEACLSNVCQVVAESNEDYEVKEEEVSTQEITLIFAWPRNNQLPLKRYDEPFREIHLRRVTKIKDFGIEVVEGPTVTTIERPGVPEIEDSQPGEKSSTKLPTSDSIVVSQKRKETVTKRVIPPQETTALPSQSSDVEEKEMRVDKSEDEDDGSSCGRPLSRDVEEDLEELLGGISDVSESFEFGGEKFQHPEHRDASAQTEGLSPDYCTWSDDQSSLLDTDTDCTDEEACFSSTGEGEHSTHAHTGAQGSMSAHTQNLTDSTNQSQPYKTNSNMYRRNASTQTGGGYIASMLPKGFGINAHGSAAQVEFASASGSVEHTLVNKASIISECTSIAAPSDKTNNSQSTSVTSSSRGGTSHSNPTQNLSTSMCVDVLPSFQSSVPCSAGPAYIKPPTGFMKSEGLIGRCLQAREHGNQLLLVAMGDDILEMDQCELADRDPGFSILHMGQCCCARSPFFDRVTLMDQIDTNIYNCADVLELENELVKYSATTIQLVTQGTLECVQPFPLVESAIWTDSLEFGMASPNFEGFIHSSADSFEKACLKHPGDKVDVCAEESTIESECVVPEIIEICANQSISETRDTKAYFAEVAYAGSENLASYEATVSNTVTDYGVAFQTEELAAWMLNMVFLTMFTQRGKHQLEKEVTNIDPRPYNDQKTGIKYARPNCTPTGTSVDCSSAPSGIIPYFAAEVSTVASECMCIVPVSIAVCGSNAMSKPKFNLSLAVDILTCDIHDDGMDQSTGSIVDDSPHVALNDTSSDISVTLQEVDLGVCRKAPDEPQDGQKHPKDTGDGKESGGKKGQKGDSSQGGTSQSTRYSTSGGQSSSFSSGTTGGGASGGSGGGGGDDDPWDRRPKRPHEQDQKRSSKKDKKSDSTDEESDEEDGYGTVVRADVVKGKEKRQGGAYSVEKVVQHISFKPIGMVENKAVEMEVSAPPEIVIPVVRMSAQSDESACKIDRSPVLMTKPPEFKSVSKSTKSTGHESSDVSSDMENFDFQDMVQKMWKPMEPLVPPPHFHPMTGKEETVVKRSMDYEYEHKSSDGTHVREAWSTKDDGGKVPSQGKPQGHLELEDTRRRSTEHAEQIVRPDLPPIVQHKVKLPRTEKKDEQVYASVKQTARMPQYAPRLETEITSSRDANISGDRQHHKKTVTKETFVTSGRQFTAPDPEGILQSFRKRASREDLTDVRKETDSSADGHGRHHTMVEVQSHDTNIPFMDDSSEPSEQVRSNVISDTVTVTREVRGSQGTTDKRLSSSAGEYYHRSASEDNEMNRHDGYDQRSVMRSNSSDGVISGRPPLPPTRRRPSEDDLPDDDPMKLFPILQYLSPKEQEEFMRRVAGNSQEQQINQAPYKPPVPPKPRKAMQMMEQQRVEGRQFEHQYARSAKPIYQAQTSDTSNSFDNIMNCRPIQPIHKIAFCAQEGTEEAPLTNYGSIDVVASYDTMEDESSCYSDTTGYSDEEYISRQSRSAGSMSDARSDHLSGTDDGILKIYHDGQLVAQIRNERAQQTTRVNLTGSAPAGEKWLYSFPGQGAQGEQRHQDGTLASIDKRTLQTIPRLEKVSPVVKHESSKAFIDDSVPGQFSEEHYNSKVIQQDLGDQGQLTGMHASSFTHTKTGSWEENQNQGGLSMRLQGVQREKTREEVHSTKSRQVNTLQDKYEDVVENLKQRILGFGRQQKSVQYHQQPYVEYPISMADTSTHGSRDSSITGASSMTGASSISSLSTVSSDRRHQQGSHMQFPGGVTGEDGILRVYYDEDIIADIKSTLHASVGTRMIDDGKVLRVYHEGNLVAEIWRREDVSSPEMHQMHTVREVSQQERTLSPVSIPDIQHTRQAPQYQVPAMKTEIGRQNAFTSERIYENDDRQSVTESVSVGSDTEDEYFFEEYTVEHKLPLYEDLPATEFKPEDKVTNVFSYYKKKDQDEEVKPVKFQRSDSYIERMEKMRQEKEFKAHEAKQRMMRIQQIQPEIQTATVKQQDYSRPTSVTVTKPVTVHAPSQKPKLKPKPKSPPKFQHVKDSRTVYLKNRPLPEIPREPDEMSVCSTSSWQTEDTESTITGRAIDDDTAEKYRQMYSLYLQQHHHKREEEEQRRVAAPTKTPPVPPPRKHKKIPPMEAYIEQKENVPISGAEAMMKDALRKIDDMYASLTRKKTLPKYARKKPVPQQPVQVDTRRTELIEEVKRHLNAIRSQTNRPMTPEYKAEITREIKRRIYESRLTDMRTSTESPGQRWLLQNKKTKDFDEVSEADSTSSWCTVASGSTVASQVAPFGEVTVIVEPNRGTDPRRSRRKVTEASYHLHQAHSSDDDHTERQYVRRTFPRQQVRRQELQPVQEYEDPRILQEMYRRQQLLDNYHRQEQFQRNTERRQNYHTISSHATHYQQQHAESPYDMPQIEDRPPSPDPVYIEHVELQEIARHTVDGQVREESPSPEPVYVEHVELQEFARHNMADQTGTLSNVRDNRTSWGGQPSVKMIGTSGKSGSMPVLDDDLYDNMLKMLSGVTKQQEDPQVYDNLPGHEGQAASPLSMSPSHEQDETTRQKTEQYLQSAYKFINEGTYDFLQDPDATPKVQHRTQSYDALDTADDGHSMRKEVQQRRRTVSQSEVSEQETLPIRGGAIHRQAAMNEQGGRYGNESTSTHGSFSQGSRSTAQTRASYQSANQGRSLSQDRLLQSGTATVPNRRIDYQVRSSSLPPGITSEQMKAEGSNQVQKRSFQTSSQSMTLPQRGFQQSDVVVHHDAEPRHQTSSLIHKSSQQRSSQSSSEQRKAYQQSSARGSKSLTRPTVPPPPPKLSTIQQNLPLDSGNQQQQFKRTSRQQQFQLSRNEANQQRVNERQMSAPPEGQRFYQQAEDQSSQARSSSVDRLQQQQQQRFSNGTQQQQRFSTGAQQQQQQQRVSTGVQQQQQRVSTGAQQQRFSSGTQQQQRFSTGEQQHQQQQRFSTGASGTGHGAMHMRYERPHSAQESYKGSMVSGQQSMRSRTASAGSSHSLPPSQRASTDR